MEQNPRPSGQSSTGNRGTSGQAGWLAEQDPRQGLGHYADVVRQHVVLILMCALVAMTGAGIYTEVAPKTYEAESRLLITPVNGESSLIGLGLITNTGEPTGVVSTAASFVTTPEVGERVARALGAGTASSVLSKVSAVPLAASDVIAITAKDSTPAGAKAIADAFATKTIESRTAALHQRLEGILPALRARVALLPVGERTGQGSLGERLVTLETFRSGPDPTISVETLSTLPTSPSWPRRNLTVLAGLLLGLLVGVAAAFAQEGLDIKVRREESLRRIFKLPVLARIPRQRSTSRLPLLPSDLGVAATEGYRMLRAGLGARTSSTAIMVTSSSASEGKSTVSLNLAATLASSGNKVILVESDLRRASLGAALGVTPEVGMAEVLLGGVALEDALITIDGFNGNLRALLVERAVPALGDGLLAASERLVERSKAFADFVIFDAPPVNDVSDVLALTWQVDDVLIVARLGHARTDQLRELGELLTRHSVRPAGVVIVGDDMARTNSYYYDLAPEPVAPERKRLFKRASAAQT